MATYTSTWMMTRADAFDQGGFSRDIVGDTPYGVVTGTEKRDVSDVLDLLALADTPFINTISWGPETGGTTIEWMSEDLGKGYVQTAADIETGQLSMAIGSTDGMDGSDSMRQMGEGAMLYYFDSAQGVHAMFAVTSITANGVSAFISQISTDHDASIFDSAVCSIVADSKMYIVGNVANEGSMPHPPNPRDRALLSNAFTILRKDVQITGTMKATDMYIVGREDRHQVLMRLKELQRERERQALYAISVAKSSVLAGQMNGVLGFLGQQSGSHIDNSTYTLTESAVNTVVSKIWENGGRNLSFFGALSQTAKFTRWDKNRIRMRQNDRKGGGLVTSYLCESGIELDLHPMANVPTNIAYVIDTSRPKLRAKKGRKAIMEKLGKLGDFDSWQILSEFSFEFPGYNLGQHGAFWKLV